MVIWQALLVAASFSNFSFFCCNKVLVNKRNISYFVNLTSTYGPWSWYKPCKVDVLLTEGNIYYRR